MSEDRPNRRERRRRLQPMMPGDRQMHGPTVKSFAVGSWLEPGETVPTKVAITIETAAMGDLVLRIKSPERVDEIIQMLLRHKREVWPDAR